MTICAVHKRPVFGRLENGAVNLNPYGKIVEAEWHRMGKLRENVKLDEYIVMPDHFHAIIFITPTKTTSVGAQLAAPNIAAPLSLGPNYGARRFWAQQAAPLQTAGGVTRNNVAPQSLSAIIRGFKSAVTRAANTHRAGRNLSPVTVWQRSFYERVIRDEKELLQTRRYIIENPLHVEHDEHP